MAVMTPCSTQRRFGRRLEHVRTTARRRDGCPLRLSLCLSWDKTVIIVLNMYIVYDGVDVV